MRIARKVSTSSDDSISDSSLERSLSGYAGAAGSGGGGGSGGVGRAGRNGAGKFILFIRCKT